jgi:hypothetical protein
MPPRRQIRARLVEAQPARSAERLGVKLRFRSEGARAPVEHIEDFADLGPEPTLESIVGFGRVLRLLRAARLAAPTAPEELLGQPEKAAQLLDRALGTVVVLEVRPRSSVRFTVWTEQGMASVDQVLDVVEDETAFLVRRRGGLPVRVPRNSVVRRQTSRETWLEVVAIERTP